jgi:hypothetical protein
MRLAGQLKMGYFAAPPKAIALAARYLRPPAAPFAILDPCCGEGAAIAQLAGLLNCPQNNVYAIELDAERAATTRAALPEANVLGPASFFGCHIRRESMSLIWLNPPFDDSGDGQRVEQQFLAAATMLLVPGGVLALVCPARVIGMRAVQAELLTWYDSLQIVPFDAKWRKYDEVIVFARRMPRLMAPSERTWREVQTPGVVYDLPISSGAGTRWEKWQLTDAELDEAVSRSPLRRLIDAPPALPIPRPPMTLSTGHLALLLAAGHLDGLIQPEDPRDVHVVRGVARKVEVETDEQVEETKNEIVTKRTISEQIQLVIRAVGLDGVVRDFG